jgi:glycerol-1-phosphate dehydrogenase [NAD(P)+]
VVQEVDSAQLDQACAGLPHGASLVIGLGGGLPVDAAKYIALKTELPLVLVPTVVSSGAIIHGIFVRDKRQVVASGRMGNFPYCDPDHVVVDYDVVLAGPWYLNTGGLGDVLCAYADVGEWDALARRGAVQPPPAEQLDGFVTGLREIAEEFPRTLSPEGSLTPRSIRFIMKSIQERDARRLASPKRFGAGHLVSIIVELMLDRRTVHGEMAALGAVSVCWAAGGEQMLRDWLDGCKVRYRPADAGISKDEFRAVMAEAVPFFTRFGVETVLVREPVVGDRFDALWRVLEGT